MAQECLRDGVEGPPRGPELPQDDAKGVPMTGRAYNDRQGRQ